MTGRVVRRGATAKGSSKPSLRLERTLLRQGHRYVAGMDEVGRGALAGPVTVGVVVVEDRTKSGPVGLRDSKLLSPAARDRLAPKVQRWAPYWALGHSSAAEIDRFGIIAALRLAGFRALAQLAVPVDVLVLDGNHDWLTPPQSAMLELTALADIAVREDPELPEIRLPKVTTMIKADLRCTAVAAASILAKTTRDAQMLALGAEQTYAAYQWQENKGYSAPEHLEALSRHGACELHRRSWRLPGIGESQAG